MRIDREIAYKLAPIVEENEAKKVFFGDANDADYALLSLGHGDERYENERYQSLVDTYHLLRGNIYGAHGYLGHSEVIDGREYDEDDARSSHYLVLKRQLVGALAIGSMRIIEKKDGNPLPVEQYFKTAFPEPAQDGAYEASRLISVETDMRQQLRITSELFRIGWARLLQTKPEGTESTVYGVIGEDLEAALTPSRLGVRTIRLADPAPVPYGTDDLPVRIDGTVLEEIHGVEALRTENVAVGAVRSWVKRSDK